MTGSKIPLEGFISARLNPDEITSLEAVKGGEWKERGGEVYRLKDRRGQLLCLNLQVYLSGLCTSLSILLRDLSVIGEGVISSPFGWL